MIRRPLLGITVMLWLKLDTIQGDQEIFMTTNPKNPGNRHGQYHFQINAGSVRWFHRNTISQVKTLLHVITFSGLHEISLFQCVHPGETNFMHNPAKQKPCSDHIITT